MDKSLGTNLHLWCFFKCANKQSRANSSTLGQPLPPSPPPKMLHTCTHYFSRVSTLYGGQGGGDKATQFKMDNSAFLTCEAHAQHELS